MPGTWTTLWWAVPLAIVIDKWIRIDRVGGDARIVLALPGEQRSVEGVLERTGGVGAVATPIMPFARGPDAVLGEIVAAGGGGPEDEVVAGLLIMDRLGCPGAAGVLGCDGDEARR